MADSLSPFEAFSKAVAVAGGQSPFARGVGCTPGNISQLLKKHSVLPARYVLKAEALTRVSRHDLRPDLHPREPEVGADNNRFEHAR